MSSSAGVAVTGVGMVTALGATAPDTCSAWLAGHSAELSTLHELADTPFAEMEAAVLPARDLDNRLTSRKMVKYMSDSAVLGCLAAQEAVTDSGIRKRANPERIGLYAATGMAAMNIDNILPVVEASVDESGVFSPRLFGSRGLAAANPLLSFRILANMPPCLVSIIECVKGPNLIFTPWEGQAGSALLEAWRAVAECEVDAALVGSADSAASPSTAVFLRQSGLMSGDEFPGSGAAYLVLERAETAQLRGSPPHARIVSVDVRSGDQPASDPLAARMGRTFAAAPAILLALHAMLVSGSAGSSEGRMAGSDGHIFSFRLETAT